MIFIVIFKSKIMSPELITCLILQVCSFESSHSWNICGLVVSVVFMLHSRWPFISHHWWFIVFVKCWPHLWCLSQVVCSCIVLVIWYSALCLGDSVAVVIAHIFLYFRDNSFLILDTTSSRNWIFIGRHNSMIVSWINRQVCINVFIKIVCLFVEILIL